METSIVSRVIIAVLAAALLILGYLYYQEQQNDVKIKLDLPGVKIEKSS